MFDDKDYQKLPGHWVLARLGKRVLRPGGLEMTEFLMRELSVSSGDDLVELAPGIGATAKYLSQKEFRSYLGIDQNNEALAELQKNFASDARISFLKGNAVNPPVPDSTADILWGEAVMTMQSLNVKTKMIAQAHRILRPGGRYAIHEIALEDSVDQSLRQALYHDLGLQVKMSVQPITSDEWKEVLQTQGFSVVAEKRLPMHLLEPARIVADEGFLRALGIAFRIMREPAARKRVLGMRSVFRKYSDSMYALGLVCTKV